MVKCECLEKKYVLVKKEWWVVLVGIIIGVVSGLVCAFVKYCFNENKKINQEFLNKISKN